MFIYSIDVLTKLDKKIDGKVALVSNSSAYNFNFESIFYLLRKKYNIVALFAPEHGFYGVNLAGENVKKIKDEKTGIDIFSLYDNGNFFLQKDVLAIFDTLIFDIQDLGLRFYTYISTLKKIIEYLGNTNKKLIILDRPALLNGTRVEGNLLDEKSQSFIGPKDLPIRYGLTIGELALLFNDQNYYDCDIEIVKMKGWDRKLDHLDYNLPWMKPSPAIPSFSAALLYSGTCLFEGTNISVGRGTYSPFEMLGAPFIDEVKLSNEINRLKLPGIITTPALFLPKFGKYKDDLCRGVYLHILDKGKAEPVYFSLTLLKIIKENYPEFLLDDDNQHTYKLLGYKFEDELNRLSIREIIESYKYQSYNFKNDSKQYYIY